MDEQDIIQTINTNANEYISFLQELVRTDSSNPPGNEKNIAKKIALFLEESNIRCDMFPFEKNRANLVAYLNDNFNGKTLVYNGHMDTVPPGSLDSWKYTPFSGEIVNNNRIYGRGTSDMKGSLAAMVIALKLLNDMDANIQGNLIVNAVAEEETGGYLGTKWCVEHKLQSIKCDFAVIGEYTGLHPLPKAIMVGEKGHLQIKVITHGKSAHASVPFLGKNPIEIMADIIMSLKRVDEYMPKIKPPIPYTKLLEFLRTNFSTSQEFTTFMKAHPFVADLLRSITTLTKTFTMLHSGVKENIIPEVCEAIINFRILPDHTVEMVLSALHNLIEDLGHSVGTEVILEVAHYTEPSYFHTWENSDALRLFKTIASSVYGKTPLYFIFPASADAEFFRNNGYCPETILFGAGSFEQAHTVNESVEIKDFLNAIKVYSLFAYNFLK